MTATYREAVDAMFELFNTAWIDGTTAIVGSIPQIFWQGVEPIDKPVVDAFYAMVSAQNVIDRQATFRNETKRYTSNGLLTIQLFCPRANSQAMDKGRQLAELCREVFRNNGTSNGVWFRNARINDLPPEENSYRFNIIVDYEFDEIA